MRGLPVGLAGLAATSPFWCRLIQQSARAQGPTTPRFFVWWYTADGNVPEWFWPSRTGALSIRSDRTNDLSGQAFNTAVPNGDRPTFLLQPLAAYANNMVLVRGVSNPGGTDHPEAVQAVFTGEAVRGNSVGPTPSLDTIVSEILEQSINAERLLRLGVYGNRVSHAGAWTPARARNGAYVAPSWSPVSDARRVLDVVGGPVSPPPGGGMSPANPNAERTASRLAIFGSVRRRLESLRCAAGSGAATRAEAYLEEIARLERVEPR